MRCSAAAPLALVVCAVALPASDKALSRDSGSPAAPAQGHAQVSRPSLSRDSGSPAVPTRGIAQLTRPSQEELSQCMARFDADVDTAARLLHAWLQFLEQHFVPNTGFFPAGVCEADAHEKAAQLFGTFCMAERTLRLELLHIQRRFCAHHGLGDVDVLAPVVPRGRSESDTTPETLQGQTLHVNLRLFINMLRMDSASMAQHMADVRAFFDARRTPAERAATLAEFRKKNSTGGVLLTFKAYYRCIAIYVGVAAQFLADAAGERQPIDHERE